jgi:hypothetical protein
MDGAAHQVPAYLPLIIAIPWLWIAGWVALSIFYRRAGGRPIFTPRPADAIYFTRGASGRSRKTLFTAMFSASRCLMVAVTPDWLIVMPTFPLNLMFLSELGDLEHKAPRKAVQAEIGRPFLGWTTIQLTFPTPAGELRRFRLILRDADAFAAALSS